MDQLFRSRNSVDAAFSSPSTLTSKRLGRHLNQVVSRLHVAEKARVDKNTCLIELLYWSKVLIHPEVAEEEPPDFRALGYLLAEATQAKTERLLRRDVFVHPSKYNQKQESKEEQALSKKKRKIIRQVNQVTSVHVSSSSSVGSRGKSGESPRLGNYKKKVALSPFYDEAEDTQDCATKEAFFSAVFSMPKSYDKKKRDPFFDWGGKYNDDDLLIVRTGRDEDNVMESFDFHTKRAHKQKKEPNETKTGNEDSFGGRIEFDPVEAQRLALLQEQLKLLAGKSSRQDFGRLQRERLEESRLLEEEKQLEDELRRRGQEEMETKCRSVLKHIDNRLEEAQRRNKSPKPQKKQAWFLQYGEETGIVQQSDSIDEVDDFAQKILILDDTREKELPRLEDGLEESVGVEVTLSIERVASETQESEASASLPFSLTSRPTIWNSRSRGKPGSVEGDYSRKPLRELAKNVVRDSLNTAQEREAMNLIAYAKTGEDIKNSGMEELEAKEMADELQEEKSDNSRSGRKCKDKQQRKSMQELEEACLLVELKIARLRRQAYHEELLERQLAQLRLDACLEEFLEAVNRPN